MSRYARGGLIRLPGGFVVQKFGMMIPLSEQLYEDALWIRWARGGTSGRPDLDAKFSAQAAAYREPLSRWEGEGGA